MNFQGLIEHLHKLLPKSRSDLEIYIESKDPKNAADIEHWLQQYTYKKHQDWFPNA